MNELIEKLKKNKVPYGLLEDDERECLRNVPIDQILCYQRVTANWRTIDMDNLDIEVGNTVTYRIKSDYQPEPKYILHKIVRKDGWLGIHNSGVLSSEYLQNRYGFLHLHCIPSMPNFDHFESYDKQINLVIDNVGITNIAQMLRNGIEVLAVFVKE